MSTVSIVTAIPNPSTVAAILAAVVDKVKDKYTLVYAGNSTTIEGVSDLLVSVQPAPALLWTAAQQAEIERIAQAASPGTKTHAVPAGLLAEAGVEGVIKYFIEHVDEVVA